MAPIPVIAFSAWSGTGKTTVIEKLIPVLKTRGLRVAAVKHDAHDFEIDRKGKDSWKFFHAGADVTVITSDKKTALIEQRSLDLMDVFSRIPDVDIILAEGFNQDDLPRIGICRKATGKGFRHPLSQYIAIVTDEHIDDPHIPVFLPDDHEGLADFVMEFLRNRLS